MSREAVLAAFSAALRTELDTLETVTRMAIDEATGDESRAENKYDTRGTEASYLARGQAERVIALRRLVGWITGARPPADGTVGVGSLVVVEEGETTRRLFLLPEGGGLRVDVDGEPVLGITRASPLGRSLVGAEAGDLVVLGPRELEVAEVC